MPGLYLYGIAAHPVRLAATGVCRRPVRSIAIAPFHVIVEEAGGVPRATMANLRRHSAVIASVVDRGRDVLPVRFGTVVSGRSQLRRVVQARQEELSQALERVKGRVQMTVRVPIDEPRAAASGSAVRGASYLRARAALERQRARNPLVRAIQRAAKPFVRASRVEWRAGPPALVSVHHLVARSRIEQYRDAVGQAMQARRAEGAVSGPWAPFAFAEVA
jgi:hypothetical protein